MAGLKAQGRGFALVPRPGVPPTPIVPSAILYDLANGGNKDWGDVTPYAALGRAAFENVGASFRLGRAGAGFGARAGQAPGGTGSASIVASDGLTVGVLAAVNSYGSVRMPGSEAYEATLDAAAEAGGFAGDTSPKYFSVSASGGIAALTSTFESIAIELITTCSQQLEDDPPDTERLNV